MFSDQFLADLQKNLSAMYNVNEQLSSSKKVNRPSDDPAAMARIVGYRATLSSIGSYNSAITSAKSYLQSMDSALNNLADLIQRGSELAISGANGSLNANDRLAWAKEASGLVDSAMGIANTRVNDRYIFAGYASDQPPIDANGNFQGDSNRFDVAISQSINVAVNLPANEFFSSGGSPDNVMPALTALKTALETNDTPGIQTALGNLNAALEKVSQAQAEIGGRLNKLDAQEKYLADNEETTKTYLSSDQDADLAAVVSEFQQRQTALESLRTVSQKIFSSSLFDFMN